jgi:hypothetical protein
VVRLLRCHSAGIEAAVAKLGIDSMIDFELLRDRSILLITPGGPLEKADFEQLAKEVDPFIEGKTRWPHDLHGVVPRLGELRRTCGTP